MNRARRFIVTGRVQGVGFRPFVYRLAASLKLTGWVQNSGGRVLIHAEGDADGLQRFAADLIGTAPALARPLLADASDAAAEGYTAFAIRESAAPGGSDVHVPPDLFCCDDCLQELRTPGARRYRYAFTNCTQCGPRYTLIAGLPYDRPKTSMAGFALCADCRAEYGDPADRRYHAQPLACPVCGPQLRFERPGHDGATGEAALAAAVALLRDGGIVAVKGIGGFHLICDAASEAAVTRLRERKHRPHKPLAVMVPLKGGDGLDALRRIVVPDEVAAAAVLDPVRPIVLVRKKVDAPVSAGVAPGLDELGVFLPYSPLHHILLQDFGGPVVATSGNISGEPVITDDGEARHRLLGIADALLSHDRPILRPADDPVQRIIAGRPRTIRVGRGLAPLELDLPKTLDRPMLATGGQMKSAIALGFERRAVLSPHIGELDTRRGLDVFRQVVADLQTLHQTRAATLVCDLHPGFTARRWAEAQGPPVVAVQHHVSHASAIAGEYPDVENWLVFAWDGVGLGSDGDLWGGETFAGAPGRWQRVASLRPFHLLGGDRAAREPWRSAAGLMWEEGLEWRPPEDVPSGPARQAWAQRINTHRTSAVGRLFDAAACLVLGIERVSFEGQGPMLLEAAADGTGDSEAVPLPLRPDGSGLLRADWSPLLPVLTDQKRSAMERAAILHESLAVQIADQVKTLATRINIDAVGLTGGVFQNKYLAEWAIKLLEAAGFRALLPAVIPANDGGLAYGQLIEVLYGGGTPVGMKTGTGN